MRQHPHQNGSIPHSCAALQPTLQLPPYSSSREGSVPAGGLHVGASDAVAAAGQCNSLPVGEAQVDVVVEHWAGRVWRGGRGDTGQ